MVRQSDRRWEASIQELYDKKFGSNLCVLEAIVFGYDQKWVGLTMAIQLCVVCLESLSLINVSEDVWIYKLNLGNTDELDYIEDYIWASCDDFCRSHFFIEEWLLVRGVTQVIGNNIWGDNWIIDCQSCCDAGVHQHDGEVESARVGVMLLISFVVSEESERVWARFIEIITECFQRSRTLTIVREYFRIRIWITLVLDAEDKARAILVCGWNLVLNECLHVLRISNVVSNWESRQDWGVDGQSGGCTRVI